MIGIKYGEFNETADLKGMSVAEAREQYTEEFGLSDKARAKLNGERISRKQEQERILVEEDELCFEEKSRKSLVLLGAFLLSLAVTGGIFAYTATVQSITLTVVGATNDFASITVNQTPAIGTLLGNHLGAIDATTMFDISGDSNYNGDLEVIVTLTNADELVEDYRFFTLRLQYTDSANVSADLEAITKIVSLSNPTVNFAVDSANISGGTFYIRTPGGVYRTLPIVLGSAGNGPVIFIEVIQAGAQ